jgi:uncharacterized protein involved in propanediol utilization
MLIMWEKQFRNILDCSHIVGAGPSVNILSIYGKLQVYEVKNCSISPLKQSCPKMGVLRISKHGYIELYLYF